MATHFDCKTWFLFMLVATLAKGEEGIPATCSACRRVLVYDAGTKPSVALRNPKYEIRCPGCKLAQDGKMTCEGCPEEKRCAFCEKSAEPDPLLCAACLAKRHPDTSTKPAVAAQNRNMAFVCAGCGNLCWRDQGKETKFEDKAECKACDQLKAELAKAAEAICPHCAKHNKPMDAGTKPTASQNIRRPCPACEKSMDDKVCKTCEESKIKCSVCAAALEEKKRATEKRTKSDK